MTPDQVKATLMRIDRQTESFALSGWPEPVARRKATEHELALLEAVSDVELQMLRRAAFGLEPL